LRAEIESGARSVDELARRCGASQYCGGCTAAVERILQMPARAVALAV
jgi:NAD(P)H-nitrite reductase large subunit